MPEILKNSIERQMYLNTLQAPQSYYFSYNTNRYRKEHQSRYITFSEHPSLLIEYVDKNVSRYNHILKQKVELFTHKKQRIKFY